MLNYLQQLFLFSTKAPLFELRIIDFAIQKIVELIGRNRHVHLTKPIAVSYTHLTLPTNLRAYITQHAIAVMQSHIDITPFHTTTS